MKITILLPFRRNSPVRGLKVMYEYANHLALRGHEINVLHFRPKFRKYSELTYPIARTLKEIEYLFHGNWFKFNKTIKISYIRYINDETILDADAIIYTFWRLGSSVENLSPDKGTKINLIQDYEDWENKTEELHKSYNLENVHNIVIASYLKEIVSKYTNKEIHILHNGIDTNYFKIQTPIEVRDNTTVCMLYHEHPRKGVRYGLKALEIIKKELPELKVIFFGINNKPENLPDFIQYHKRPKNLPGIYNQSAIFITNSLQEDWGLPALEAMACGCALICTNVGGHLDFANKENAIIVEPEDSKNMAESIKQLILNPEERIKLGKKGNISIKKFSWEASTVKLENYLKNFRT